MTIADKLTLLASSKEALRVKLGLPKSLPFSEYYKHSYPFDPMTLFAGGEQGVWYDPSDKSTLFQDVEGIVPVTKDGDPVALMLDKSQGLVSDSELVNNGTFNSDLSGWTANSSVQLTRDTSVFESGGAKITITGPTISTYFSQSLGSNFVVGRSYKATALVYTPSTNSLDCRAAIGIISSGLSTKTVFQKNTDTVETISIIFTATSTTHSLYCSIARTDAKVWGAVGDKAIFDSISVKELKGNHATQTASTSRPVYKTDGILHWLGFDGVDDHLLFNKNTFLADKSQVIMTAYNLLKAGEFPPVISGLSTDAGLEQFHNGNTAYRRAALITNIGNSAGNSAIPLPLNTAIVRTTNWSRSAGVATDTVNIAGAFTTSPARVNALLTLPTDYQSMGRIDRFYANMGFYGAVAISDDLSPTAIADVEQYLAAKSGVTL